MGMVMRMGKGTGWGRDRDTKGTGWGREWGREWGWGRDGDGMGMGKGKGGVMGTGRGRVNSNLFWPFLSNIYVLNAYFRFANIFDLLGIPKLCPYKDVRTSDGNSNHTMCLS
jgi:hypothetical protein